MNAIYAVMAFREIENKMHVTCFVIAAYSSDDAIAAFKEARTGSFTQFDYTYVTTDEAVRDAADSRGEAWARVHELGHPSSEPISKEHFAVWVRTMTKSHYSDGYPIPAHYREFA